jgi:threonine dehydrogenase-like Zn-dependent dehydrogenase
LDGILDCMAKFGRVALLGCTRDKEFTIDYYSKVHGPGITLIGAHTIARPKQESHEGWWTEYEDYESLIRLTQLGRIKLSTLVDETHSAKDAVAIFNRLAVEKSFPVTQLDWREME